MFAYRPRPAALVAALALVLAALSVPLVAPAAQAAAPATLSGAVRDEQGTLLRDVCVELPSTLGSTYYARTGVDGLWLSDVPAGTYGVVVRDCGGRGLAPTYYDGADKPSAATMLTVAAADTRSDLDVVLHLGGSITGTVTVPAGAGSSPRVCVSATTPYSPDRGVFYSDGGSGVVGAGGRYEIRGLNTASYIVSFSDCSGGDLVGGYYPAGSDYSSAIRVAVTRGQATSNIDVAMSVGGAIAGLVRDDNASPLARVCVDVTDESGAYVSNGYTAADGRYVAHGVPAGQLTVGFNDCGGRGLLTQFARERAATDAADPIAVTAGQVTDGVDAVLHVGGSLSGTVRDGSGIPVPDLCVHAFAGGAYSGYTSTAADGSYTIRGLPSDQYRVQAYSCRATGDLAPTYAPNVTDATSATPTPVIAPDTASSVDITMQPAGSVSGVVTTPEGAALAGMCVSVYGSSYGSTRTAVDGAFRIQGLAPYDGYSGSVSDCTGGDRVGQDWPRGIVVRAGEDNAVGTLALPLGGRIGGTVRDVRGIAIAQACVSGRGFAQTALDGTYTLHGVPAGTSTVTARDCSDKTDHLPRSYRADGADGPGDPVTVAVDQQTSGIDVALPDAGGIAGRLSNTRLPVCVEASTGTGQSGRQYAYRPAYKVGDLPAGDYRVSYGDCSGNTYRWYHDQPTFDAATSVRVTAGQVTTGIDEDFNGQVAGETALQVSLTANPASGSGPLTTRLQGALSGGGTGPFSYVLDFGDGTGDVRGALADASQGVAVDHVYRVAAVRTATLRVTSPGGTVVTASTPVTVDPRLPGAPSGLHAEPGDAQITVTWNAPTDLGDPQLTGYRIEAQPSGAAVEITGRSGTVTVPNGVEQSLTVRARSTAGLGAPSEAVLATARARTAISLTVSPDSGDPLASTTLTATVAGSAGVYGVVQLYDGGRYLGSAQVDTGGTAQLTTTLAPGTHSLTASYEGSTSDQPSTSAAVTATRDPYATSTTFAGGDRTVASDDEGTILVTVATTGLPTSVPSGTVTVAEGATTVATGTLVNGQVSLPLAGLPVGQHSLLLTYGGDATHAGSTSTPVVLTVLDPSTTTAQRGSAVFGEPVELRATVTVPTGSQAPTGTVVFMVDGGAAGSVSVAADDTAHVAASALTVATHQVTAAYSGDAKHVWSMSDPADLVVTKASTALALVASPTPLTSIATAVLTATVAVTAPGAATPSGTVTFTDGPTTLGTAALGSDGAAQLSVGRLSAGTHALRASYDGDEHVLGSAADTTVAVDSARGAVEVTVQAAGGGVLESSTVAVVLPDGSTVKATTGSDGVARVGGLPDGSLTVAAVHSGYRPAKATLTTVDGAASVTITLQPGALADATVTTHPMTPDEMIAVGIDPTDPANQNVVEFTVALPFLRDSGGAMHGYYSRGTFPVCPTVDGATVSCGGGGGGGGGSVWFSSGGYDYTVTGDSDRLVWMKVPAKATWLKEFFDVELMIVNLSDDGFTLDRGTATLDVPAGLPLAPTGTPQTATQSMPDIPGGQSRSVSWYVRGDVEGFYDVTASYAGTLEPFGDAVSLRAVTAKPLHVWGASALSLTADADDRADIGDPYHLTLHLKNVADVPVYNLGFQAGTAGATGFIYQPRERLSTSVAELAPGATLERDYVLVPTFSGSLVVDEAFVARSAGVQAASPAVTAHPVAEPPLELTATPLDHQVGLTFAPTPGATSYQLFTTSARDVAFASSPTAGITFLPDDGTGVLRAVVPADPAAPAFYAISSVVDGVNVMKHPLVSTTAAVGAVEPTSRVSAKRTPACPADATGFALSMTFDSQFFPLRDYVVSVGDHALAAQAITGQHATAATTVPLALMEQYGNVVTVVAHNTNGDAGPARATPELNPNCLDTSIATPENTFVLGAGATAEGSLDVLKVKSSSNSDGSYGPSGASSVSSDLKYSTALAGGAGLDLGFHLGTAEVSVGGADAMRSVGFWDQGSLVADDSSLTRSTLALGMPFVQMAAQPLPGPAAWLTRHLGEQLLLGAGQVDSTSAGADTSLSLSAELHTPTEDKLKLLLKHDGDSTFLPLDVFLGAKAKGSVKVGVSATTTPTYIETALTGELSGSLEAGADVNFLALEKRLGFSEAATLSGSFAIRWSRATRTPIAVIVSFSTCTARVDCAETSETRTATLTVTNLAVLREILTTTNGPFVRAIAALGGNDLPRYDASNSKGLIAGVLEIAGHDAGSELEVERERQTTFELKPEFGLKAVGVGVEVDGTLQAGVRQKWVAQNWEGGPNGFLLTADHQLPASADGLEVAKQFFTRGAGNVGAQLQPIVSGALKVATQTLTAGATNVVSMSFNPQVTITLPPDAAPGVTQLATTAAWPTPTRPTAPTEVFGVDVVSAVWTATPDVHLAAPATVQMTYDSDQVGGTDPSTYALFRYDGSLWHELPSTVDPATNTVTATTSDLGVLAIGVDDIAPTVRITSPATGQYGAGSGRVTAIATSGTTAFDALNVDIRVDGRSLQVSRLDGQLQGDFSGLPDGAHTLVVSVTGRNGVTGSASSTFSVDTEAPAAPGDVRSSTVTGGTAVSWSPSPGATHYVVYRLLPDGTVTQLAGVAGTAFTDSAPVDGAVYAVAAVDDAGNTSRTVTPSGTTVGPVDSSADLPAPQPGMAPYPGGGSVGGPVPRDSNLQPPPARPEGVTRFAGIDRYSTAAAVSAGSFPTGSASDVFIVTGENWPDALAAGAAAAEVNGPVLPVMTASIPNPIASELDRLAPTRAWVVGGTSVVDDSVLQDLQARGIVVERVSGGDRYLTAAAVAHKFFVNPAGAYYASGAVYADALGGGAAAAKRGWPLLLTTRDSVPADTPIIGTERIALGGTAAISDAVVAQLQARRVAGDDRFATAAAVARDAFSSAPMIYLATGLKFPDALAGTVAAARANAPVLLTLTDCVTQATKDAATALGGTSRVVLGGTAVVSDRAANLTLC